MAHKHNVTAIKCLDFWPMISIQGNTAFCEKKVESIGFRAYASS